MKAKTVAGLPALAIFLLLMLGFSPRGAAAQNNADSPERRAAVRQALQKNETARRIYDRLVAKEPDVVPIEFSPPDGMSDKKILTLQMLTREGVFMISLREYKTPENAGHLDAVQVGLRLNMGFAVQFDKFGDEGVKIFGNKFEALEFRKGRFIVYIHGRDESAAERLAGDVADSL
ncbi:MAG: hypothetical protein JSS81_15850 [Acidobacteria bacterium]|nr:hypothetical protein [Acidobacteriota bacterium]